MGADCCHQPSQLYTSLTSNVPKIYGNYIDRETRVIVALCMFGDQDYEFKEISMGSKEQTQQEYVSLNPTKEIPTIIVKN